MKFFEAFSRKTYQNQEMTVIYCDMTGKYLKGFINQEWISNPLDATNYKALSIFKKLYLKIVQRKCIWKIRYKYIVSIQASFSSNEEL